MQTAGELRVRTERLHAFPDTDAVEAAMRGLIEFPDEPLAVMIPPGHGRKAAAYAHLLCGPVDMSLPAPVVPSRTLVEAEADWRSSEIKRKAKRLELETARLAGKGETMPVLLRGFQRLTQRSVKHIRWLRAYLFHEAPRHEAVAVLRLAYATF